MLMPQRVRVTGNCIFEMKRFKSNCSQMSWLWVSSEQCLGPEVKEKTPREKEIILNEKPKQLKVLLEVDIFTNVIWGEKAPNILLCICRVQVPANRYVAEGDLILITAFSQAVDVFTRCIFSSPPPRLVTEEGEAEALYRNPRPGVYGRSGTALGLNWFNGQILTVFMTRKWGKNNPKGMEWWKLAFEKQRKLSSLNWNI